MVEEAMSNFSKLKVRNNCRKRKYNKKWALTVSNKIFKIKVSTLKSKENVGKSQCIRN